MKRLTRIWRGMLRRCQNTTDAAYKYYGLRGVTVCPEWQDRIAFCKWALANGYADTLTIDRQNPFGHYEPDNCRWIPRRDQYLTKRVPPISAWEIDGVVKTDEEWAKHFGLTRNAFRGRVLRARKWAVDGVSEVVMMETMTRHTMRPIYAMPSQDTRQVSASPRFVRKKLESAGFVGLHIRHRSPGRHVETESVPVATAAALMLRREGFAVERFYHRLAVTKSMVAARERRKQSK